MKVRDAGRPAVVVLGATREETPPGIERGADLADLRFAPDADALVSVIDVADALFFWRATKDWLEHAWPKADRLRWIQSASDGVDRLLFPALVEREDVVVTNARGVFDEAIAEWVIGAILAFETGLATSIRDTAGRRWDDEPRSGRVAGSRLLVVGPGPIGRATAVRARALGMRVSAVGRSTRADDVFERVGGPRHLHEMLGQADYVLDALPLTETTHHLFDADAFEAMRPAARFLNVGRGSTVDEPALVRALEDGRIAGVALDVFEEEPLPADSPLWSLPGAIVSPHICGDFEGWERAVVGVFVDNLARFARGERLRNLVDKAAGFGVG